MHLIWRLFSALALSLVPLSALALEVGLTAPGAPEELEERLQAASTIFSANSLGLDTSQELLAASLADYKTLVQVLYDQGYFSPVVSIRLNGQEAAAIDTISPPQNIQTVVVTVQTGPSFTLGRAEIGPLAEATEIPEGYHPGAPASTRILQDAARAAVNGWRDAGHAKASIGRQNITANHGNATLDADIELLPGPALRFGKMNISGQENVREDAIRAIAGFPSGRQFDPKEVQKVGARLRRAGAFSSVNITEAETPNADGTLDLNVEFIESLPRRLSFGVEVASRTGMDVSALWTHRNLLGGSDRLRFEARIRNIGGQEDIDGLLSVRLDQPSKLGPDDNLFYLAEIEQLNKTYYNATRAALGVGVTRVFSDDLKGELLLGANYTIADDAFGSDREFRMFLLPGKLEYDKRDNPVDPRSGYFADFQATPFVGISGTKSGLHAFADGRAYASLTSSESIVLAGRLQIGTVLGPALSEITPEFLFFSGGAGTVRGQPYESLGVPVGTGIAGGRSLMAASAEVRGKITEKIWLVGFFDIGAVDGSGFVDSNSPFHSGAGLGVRYDVGGLGPLRLDLALPVDGTTGEGLQFYLGIGQAF